MSINKNVVSLDKTAEELAKIMVEHLTEMPPNERKARISAGEKVLQGRVKGEDSYFSGNSPIAASKSGIVRTQLAVRGR